MKTITIAYGFPELRELYRKNVLEGLIIAGLIHALLIMGYQMYLEFSNKNIDFPKVFIQNKRIVLPAPPPIGNSFTPPNISAAAFPAAEKGIPIPFPDAVINPDATIPTQSDMNTTSIVGTIGNENGAASIIDEHISLWNDDPPPSFVPVEKNPIVITKVSPLYPEIPRRSGIEGIVYVKMWVTKEGKVKTAQVVKSTSPLFDQAAIDAAMQWTFTPAIMNNGPVSIWVTVPFRFRLHSPE